ncbi:MAG: hypothetical protein FWG02_04460 [Holophagaceae bacterium]|nr:hypothetical protein [Holophagaceae bacterium]
MNTKQLRQKILDLAIHGKLVPQAPSEYCYTLLANRNKVFISRQQTVANLIE